MRLIPQLRFGFLHLNLEVTEIFLVPRFLHTKFLMLTFSSLLSLWLFVIVNIVHVNQLKKLVVM
jgi:hypothetical protein